MRAGLGSLGRTNDIFLDKERPTFLKRQKTRYRPKHSSSGDLRVPHLSRSSSKTMTPKMISIHIAMGENIILKGPAAHMEKGSSERQNRIRVHVKQKWTWVVSETL